MVQLIRVPHESSVKLVTEKGPVIIVVDLGRESGCRVTSARRADFVSIVEVPALKLRNSEAEHRMHLPRASRPSEAGLLPCPIRKFQPSGKNGVQPMSEFDFKCPNCQQSLEA